MALKMNVAESDVEDEFIIIIIVVIVAKGKLKRNKL